MTKPLLLATALLLASATQAQTVWRCGPDGRSYADEPCAGGRLVAVADPRSAADRAAALDLARREQALADTLAQQRRDRAAQAVGAAGIGPSASPAALKAPRQTPSSSKKRQRQPSPAAPGTWRATAPGSPRTTG